MFNLKIKKDERQTQMAVMAGLAVFVAIYLFFILRPQLVSIVCALGNSIKVAGELGSAKTDIANIPKFKKTIEAYRGKIELAEKRLPAEREIPSLLESLSDMARRCNVKIVSITPVVVPVKAERSSRSRPVYQEIPIAITAKSGYHELGSFISKLENSDRFMMVDDIEIRANKANPRSHDVELIVMTYISLTD
jgi:type IV pilus assembly protein PilO